MDEPGNYEKAASSVPTLYSHENKDTTQVVYIYSTSSEIKHEPADQQSFDECRGQDESHTTNAYRKEPRPLSEDSRINWSQRREESESTRASSYDGEIEIGRNTFRGEKFLNYQKSWGRDGRPDQGDRLGIFKRDRSPNDAKKSTSDRRKPSLKGKYYNNENVGSHRSFPVRDSNDDERAGFVEGYYSTEYMHDTARREQFEENERSEWYKAESKQNNYEDNGRAGRKSFTPIRIYPHSKEVYRDRAQPYKKLEYRYGELPPNVTLVGQAGRNSHDLRGKEDRCYEEESTENDSIDAKMRNHKHIKCEGIQEGHTSMSMVAQRRDAEGFRNPVSEGQHIDEKYGAERLDKEERYRWEKEFSRGKNIGKMQEDYTPGVKESKYMKDDTERRVSPDSYARYGHREKYPRFACEISGGKEPQYRYFECYGGHEYDYPRKCERYNDIVQENDMPRMKGKSLERPRAFESHSPEMEEKRIASQKGYMMPGYQRCCCPCCPCYSIFRQTQRERSPVSPRCPPQKAPISPASASRPSSHPSHAPNELPKARSSTITQQMPPELQLKMVARGLPHLRRRRNRTVYTHDQIEELEEVFKIKHYLDVDEKGSIAKRLGIRTENVEIWFKNRRAKWRKEMKSIKSNSDGETSQYLDEDESNNGEDSENYERKSLTSIFSKDIPEERPTMTLYHTGQDTHDNEADSTVVLAPAT